LTALVAVRLTLWSPPLLSHLSISKPHTLALLCWVRADAQEESASPPRTHPCGRRPNRPKEMSPLQKQDLISGYVYPTTVPAIWCLHDGDNPGGERTFPYCWLSRRACSAASEQYLGGWKCHCQSLRLQALLDRAGVRELWIGAAGM